MAKTRYVCIVNTRREYDGCGDYEWVNDIIADWSEVSDADFDVLNKYALSKNWSLVERLDKQEDFIPKTIAEALIEAKKLEEQEKKRKEEAEKKKRERELKKKAKNEEQEKALLEELQKKYAQA